MNTLHQGLLVLVKSALTGQSLPLPEGFTLEAAKELIRSQSLVPLVYPGAIQCGLNPKTEQMQKYQVRYFRHLVISDRQMRTVDRVLAAFEEQGIDYMVLKGCNLKKLYPRPEMRPMGDADILIRMDQYKTIRPVMQQLELNPVKESSYDFVWQNEDLYLELHKRLYSPAQELLCRYFGTGWERAVAGSGHGHQMTREDEYAYIFSHMAKHFRICGIGVRHLIDLYVYRNAYPDMDEKQIERIMKQLQMLEFYRNVRRTLDVWFAGEPADAVTDMITEYVFSSGCFGTMENKLYYEELTKAGKRKATKRTRLGSFIDAIFPPLNLMQASYIVLIKYPILYPFFWPVRWIDVLLHRRRNIKRKLHIINNISDEKVMDRERTMKLMGVNFDCDEDDD